MVSILTKLIRKFLENQRGVGPAEAKGIGHGSLDGGLAGHLRNVIQIALITRMFMINRRWNYIIMQR